MILLSDDFELPEGLEFHGNTYNPDSYNLYNLTNWAKMEVAGAVFLPVTGYREKTAKKNATIGYYWTGKMSSTSSPYAAYYINIANTGTPTINSKTPYWGMAVRLVRDVE